VSDQTIVERDVDDLTSSGLRQLKLSSDFYDRRRKMSERLRKGDWWIALGLYLILAGIAFVVL